MKGSTAILYILALLKPTRSFAASVGRLHLSALEQPMDAATLTA